MGPHELGLPVSCLTGRVSLQGLTVSFVTLIYCCCHCPWRLPSPAARSLGNSHLRDHRASDAWSSTMGKEKNFRACQSDGGLEEKSVFWICWGSSTEELIAIERVYRRPEQAAGRQNPSTEKEDEQEVPPLARGLLTNDSYKENSSHCTLQG